MGTTLALKSVITNHTSTNINEEFMALIKWKDQYSVGITKIDNEHMKLVDLINKLHESMRDQKTNEVLGSIISELVDYTKFHFSTEENYFAMYNYPETESHKKAHRAFVNKISDFEKGFKTGKLMLSMEIINFLKEWLVKHIQVTDKSYSDFLIAKGL